MDFAFSEAQEIFRRSLRDFLQHECPRTLVREIEDKKLDHSAGLYEKLAQLGWLGLLIPEEYGGLGGDWIDMAIFCEEAGRTLLPGPHFSTVVLGAQALLAFGSEEQKASILPRVASGEVILALAATEPGGCDPALLAATASPSGEDFVIEGTKLFVESAHLADYIITVARVGSAPEGATLLLVPGKAHGVTVTTMETLGGVRLGEVRYERVRVPQGNVLGEVGGGGGITKILDQAKVMTCAEMLGGAQAALEMAVDYSKHRYAFGVPIGSFQALQHKMVGMLVAIEKARWITYHAAWLNSQGLASARETAIACLRAGEAYRYATAEAIQVFGGSGCMEIHDIGLHYRKAKAAQLSLGFPDVHREKVAVSLGL